MLANLDDIVKDGFNFDDKGYVEIDLALISLKIALKAYFSTYQTFKTRLHIFSDNTIEQEDINFNHYNNYCEACAETIVHFQHFAELVCKKLLRDDHPLLSDVALSKPKILHKLLHGKNLAPDEEYAIRSIEFSEALERLIVLIKDNALKNSSELSFIKEHKETLTQLNSLRNRIWHRGVYILRYPSLDTFIGQYVLPFVSDVLKLPAFSSYTNLWKYEELHCGIDPIEEIIKESNATNPDIGKLAFLKELGRASYKTPLRQKTPVILPIKKLPFFSTLSELIYKKDIKRAERIASLEASQEYSQLKICPVCGVNSLIIYDETDYETDNDFNETMNAWNYTYMVKCECCTFNLEQDIKNASEYGFYRIDDYWVVKNI